MMLGTSTDKVVVRNYDGSGHYGRSNGGSTGAEDEAVIISQAVGQAGPAPVDALGRHAVVDAAPAGVLRRAGGPRRERQARRVPGRPLHAGDAGRPHGRCAARRAADDLGADDDAYPGTFGSTVNGISDPWVYDQVPNAQQRGLGTFQIGQKESPTQVGLRDHSQRTPGQRQQNFAQESMINELAAAAKIDPIEFRIGNTSAPRLLAVMNTVKTESGWETRPSPSPKAATTGSKEIIGQGFSVMLRSNAYWACAVQVSVVPDTGKVRVLDVTTASIRASSSTRCCSGATPRPARSRASARRCTRRSPSTSRRSPTATG